ncbi:nitrite reductase small subunit NirD [Pseudonocardia endophytica]|uniref:Nitrite reductase (NADH) small subunit n=1 Tax=Pseudonocardia endophytica TaxID=401976 RepID=A0A4R1HUR0_PSEEN|nr:nitrite reductase small subunit NirD [Pseudonocardia endophytica]TCK26457.1 nitrite reductase (NADH) small subunit [Pseudonocardia endophytica]
MTADPSTTTSRVADPATTADLPEARASQENRPPAREGVEPGAWLRVCALDRLQPGRGVAALVGGVQVAVFRTGDEALYAVGNIDPFTGAAVISRGIVGDRGGVPTVASPVHKQAFGLADGRCLDDPAVALAVYQPRSYDGDVWIGLR